MQCFHPITIRSPNTGEYHQVACGKCFSCQSKRRQEYVFRLKEELKHSVCSYTVTLTYDDLHLPPLESFCDTDPLDFGAPLLPVDMSMDEFISDKYWYFHPYRIEDVQKFLKVLRKKYKFRYFGVAEYGTHSNRPHYHIMFFFQYAVSPYDFEVLVRKKWLYGSQIVFDITSDDCIGYCTKYCLKYFDKNQKQPGPKIFCSKFPFIGYSYFSWSRLKHHMLSVDSLGDITVQDGKEVRLPRIYRRIFTDNQKKANTDLMLPKLEDLALKDIQLAEEQGITYEQLLEIREQEFNKKVLKQIKQKQL